MIIKLLSKLCSTVLLFVVVAPAVEVSSYSNLHVRTTSRHVVSTNYEKQQHLQQIDVARDNFSLSQQLQQRHQRCSHQTIKLKLIRLSMIYPSLSMLHSTALGSTLTTTTKPMTFLINRLYQCLPKCRGDIGSILYVGIISGLTALFGQFAFTQILLIYFNNINKSKSHETYTAKSLSVCTSTSVETASYTAHTVVAMIFVLTVSFVGMTGWLFHQHQHQPLLLLQDTKQKLSTFYLLEEQLDTARWLAAMVSGVLLLWDIPTSFMIQKLRTQPLLLAHHIAMAFVSLSGALSLPCYYIYFYLGISELSSIPLLMYDQISYVLNQFDKNEINSNSVNASVVGSETDGNTSLTNHLAHSRSIVEVITAISFTLVRAYWFTKVTMFHFVPDVMSALSITSDPLQKVKAVMNNIDDNRISMVTPMMTKLLFTKRTVMQFLLLASISFTILQLYWFTTIVKTVVIKLRGTVSSVNGSNLRSNTSGANYQS